MSTDNVGDQRPDSGCRHRPALALVLGAPIGLLGGLIGLGGAEFRLPVLVGCFRYPASRAVALNLAVSLATLAASLAARLRVTHLPALEPLSPLILPLIAGSMVGAYVGASYASRISERHLEKVILVLLVSIGLLLIGEAFLACESSGVPLGPLMRLPLATAFGVGIGLVSSLLGVAGGELIIPTLVFVFGVDIKLAGTASVLISLPTVLVGLARYTAKRAFVDRRDFPALVLPMGVGSILGALIGGRLMAYTPNHVLKLVLGAILLISAVKIFSRQRGRPETGAAEPAP